MTTEPSRPNSAPPMTPKTPKMNYGQFPHLLHKVLSDSSSIKWGFVPGDTSGQFFLDNGSRQNFAAALLHTYAPSQDPDPGKSWDTLRTNMKNYGFERLETEENISYYRHAKGGIFHPESSKEDLAAIVRVKKRATPTPTPEKVAVLAQTTARHAANAKKQSSRTIKKSNKIKRSSRSGKVSDRNIAAANADANKLSEERSVEAQDSLNLLQVTTTSTTTNITPRTPLGPKISQKMQVPFPEANRKPVIKLVSVQSNDDDWPCLSQLGTNNALFPSLEHRTDEVPEFDNFVENQDSPISVQSEDEPLFRLPALGTSSIDLPSSLEHGTDFVANQDLEESSRSVESFYSLSKDLRLFAGQF